MSRPIFTIGHSNRSLEEFIQLLVGNGVDLVSDVRKLAGSTANPQFNADALADALEQVGILYRRSEPLGGRRPVSRVVPPEVNQQWRNQSFHNYADYALTDEFRGGLPELRGWSLTHGVAVMCSEAVWWRCHRRIIADQLLAHGEEVFHIMARDRTDPARLTPGAVMGDVGVTYLLLS